jgi:hypothetical protein
MNKSKFEDLKKQLKLKVSFSDYPTMLIKMLTNAIRDPSIYKSLMSMGLDSSAELIFQQSVEYKNIELYRCHFEQADEETIKSQVSYKFRLA